MNARRIAKDNSLARFNAALAESDMTREQKEAATAGYLDGHKAGFRASSGSVYIALNEFLGFIKDDSPVSEIRTGLEGLRNAVKESAR